jgi:outer membrane scaffolding protein for murein synthesis (MipA/OmpV family)
LVSAGNRTAATLAGIALAVASPNAHSESVTDFFHSLDLNEYALGAFYYHSQSPYDGVDNFNGVFPLPSTFDHPVFSDYTFYLRDGDFGLRKIFSNGWELAGVASLQTLGYGSGQSPALEGMRRRDWTIQMGASVGRMLGPVRLDLVGQTDVLGENGGQEYTFKLALPFRGDIWQLVPQIDAKYQSDDLVNHYFGVTEEEARPGRPAYAPGGATTLGASLNASLRINPKWYLTATASLDFLPDQISNSPIVDTERTARLWLGIAYDAPVFVAAHDELDPLDLSSFGFTLGAFYAQSESNVNLFGLDESESKDLEGELNLEDASWIPVLSAVWRIRRYHRIELGYVSLNRKASLDLTGPLITGDVTFDAGEHLTAEFNTSIFKLMYGFSLIQDEQKELSILGGLHVTDVGYRVASSNNVIDASTTTVMPSIGAHFTVRPFEKWYALLRLEYFGMDVGQNSGDMVHFSVTGQYEMTDNMALGAGYLSYRQDITSSDPDFTGDYQFEYTGPTVYVRARF